MRFDLEIADMVWSYSRLTAFEDCPYLWMMKYIYHEKGHSKFFAQYGSFMHKILQKYFSGDITKDEALVYYVKNFSRDVYDNPPNVKIYENYHQQGRQYLKSLSFPARKVLGVEHKINFSVGGYPFVGFIDLVSENNGSLYITDHKSRALKKRSTRKKPTKQDEELDKYYRQLYLYSIWVFDNYGKYPDYLEFNCFRTGELIAEPFEAERLEKTKAWACETIKKITENDDWGESPEYWFCTHLCDLRDCEYSR